MNVNSIRPLELSDLPALWDVLVKEARPQMRYPLEEGDPDYFISLWEGIIGSGCSLSFVVVDESGEIASFLLGLISRDPYSGKPIAYEQFWYARQGKGKDTLKLIHAFHDEAHKRGCVRLFVGDWFPRGGVDLSKVYGRMGFVPLERYFVKEVLCQ